MAETPRNYVWNPLREYGNNPAALRDLFDQAGLSNLVPKFNGGDRYRGYSGGADLPELDGYSLGQEGGGYGDGDKTYIALRDQNGNIVGQKEYENTNSKSWLDRAIEVMVATGAGAVAGGATGLFGSGAGAGSGAAEAGIGTLGTISPSAATTAVAPLATTGLASTAPLITSAIPQAAGGLLAAGAATSGAAPATNAALAESASGTAGYGASSAGAGGGAGELAAAGTSGLGQIGSGLLDYIKQNPKVVGGLLGAVTGGAGGLSSGSSEAPYTGPMPTIARGGWQPRAQAAQMALPQFGQGLKTTPGAANSGLWRFMGQ